MADTINWPDLPAIDQNDPQSEAKNLLFQAKLDLEKAEHQARIDREKLEATQDFERERAAYAHHYEIHKIVYAAYIQTARGEVERSVTRADFVQKAAAAIGTAHAAILGLSFAAADGGTPLPGRGLVPGIFLGFSFFLSTAYVSYVTTPRRGVDEGPTAGSLIQTQRAYRDTFIRWASAIILRRKYLLQASVVSLGFGVVFLPLAYLEIENDVLTLVVVGALLVTLGLPWLLARLWDRAKSPTS